MVMNSKIVGESTRYDWYTTTTPAAPNITETYTTNNTLDNTNNSNWCCCCEFLNNEQHNHTSESDEDGFGGVVMSVTGGAVFNHYTNSSSAPHHQISHNQQQQSSSICCVNNQNRATTATTTTTTDNRETGWCKPSVLVLFVLLLIIIFVIVSAILLYLSYMTYKPRPPILEEPCEKTFCAYGAACHIDTTGEARCKCQEDCPEFSGHPVCGSDGHTYINECVLRKVACQRQENIRVHHSGECDLPDPCRDKQCPPGAKCITLSDGRSAHCECPSKCPVYGDHAAVCGSDGIDYRNLCELRRAACRADTEITVRYHGKCDPCAGVTCSPPEECQLDADRNAVCKCGETCPLDFSPVCGSDGKTYSNECSLRQQSCRSHQTLRIIYRGKCSSGVNPCSGVRCTSGQECIINKFGIARCECPPECEPVVRSTCGDDGRTYDSLCELKRSACLSRRRVAVSHSGACGAMGPCSRHVCQHGAHCVEKGDGLPHCECPECPAEFSPVCGSDGLSYDNECKLRLEACTHRRDIKLLYEGLCNGCENKQCEFYSLCESDGNGGSTCVCPSNCVDAETSSVCGTDGKTYKSECELKSTSCKAQQIISVAYKGDCDLCQNVQCQYGARCERGECLCPSDCDNTRSEPICASDMKTYMNECEMQKYACNTAQILTVTFFGECRESTNNKIIITTTIAPVSPPMLKLLTPLPTKPIIKGQLPSSEVEACKDIRCDFAATCELGPDNFPRCSCRFDCINLQEQKPICASDHRLYPSDCVMKMEGCQRQEELRPRPMEICQGMEVKPCGGAIPLISPETGVEYDCGSGPRRQDCPSGSYCHQTSHFAKCCRKVLSTNIDETTLAPKGCQDSWYGCCPDGTTTATGPDNAGCPSMCNCNKLGSFSDDCELTSGQCECKPGVGGLKCDRCEPGYWGLPKISEGFAGCIPCGCSILGSVRDDCEQMTGRCVCKPGIHGEKCTDCAPTFVLGPNGCIPYDVSTPAPTSCYELTCYFGASCEMRGGKAECACKIACSEQPPTRAQTVCGNDGQTYTSECQMKQYACRYQKEIIVQAMGSCRDLGITEAPVRRSTAHRSTEPEDISSPLYKSTRHLLPLEHYDSVWGIRSATSGNVHGIRPTPATIRALVGDLCTKDIECRVLNSQCVRGACVCKDGHAETPDRQDCLANTLKPTLQFRACTSYPCHHGGTCIDLSQGGYQCECEANWTGPQCQQATVKKEYEIPSFDGHAYVELKRLKAYNKLSIEIEFKTYANDGILLYNQQKNDGTGDFVSLAIVNGYVEFRYNLGNGPVVIISHEKVQMKKFHHIVARRYHRDGVLKLDNSDEVAGQSQGSLKSLDLQENAFIGYVPSKINKVFDNIGTNMGLIGCIRKLKIGRRVVELHAGRDSLVEKTEGVGECGENPCSAVPCHNMGTCLAIDSERFKCVCNVGYTGEICEILVDPCASSPCYIGSTCIEMPPGSVNPYTCQCPPGRKGKTCQEVDTALTEVFVPEFHGDSNSYLALSRLENVARSFSIELWFLTRKPNGLLLYNGQLEGGKGDFISLNIINGFIQFRFDLGSGTANITSADVITLNDWHSVRISRIDKEGSLQVNNETISKGSSGPPLNELNLELPLYLGGVPTVNDVSRDAGVSTGLDGAIQRLIVNGDAYDDLLIKAIGKRGVTQYNGPPCLNKCKNGGVCHPRLNQYHCKCPPRYIGQQCEQYIGEEDVDQPVRFTGETFLQYPNKVHKINGNVTTAMVLNTTTEYYDEEYDIEEEILNYEEEEYNDEDEDDFEFFDKRRKGERNNRYEFTIKSTENNGLLLWINKGNTLKNDYFAIAIVNGYPEVSLNLGRQKSFFVLKSKTSISDGSWHRIVVQRRKRQAQIIVDGSPAVKGIAEQGASLLNTNGRLWIGGAPALPPGLPAQYYLGYRGCVASVRVDRRPLHLIRHGDNKITQFCQAD